MRVTFWGAAETVTGSRHLVEVGDRRVLIDCGLFQGLKRLRLLNWQPFPVDPASIDAVVLTHAHIDHSGFLPALVRDGFAGPIWCTEPTEALARILLPDSAHLHEEDARIANRRRSSRHEPALPLYTTRDAERCLPRFRAVPFGQRFEPTDGLGAAFSPVGHILGAAAVHLDQAGASVTFSGDVGRPVDPLMRPPEPCPAADHIVTESTYGNRHHPDVDPSDELADVINRTLRRRGSVLIPVFAVGRAQTLLHLLSELRRDGRIPDVPTYLNSPMAVNTTELFCRFTDQHRLSVQQCEAMCDDVTFVRTADESMQLTSRREQNIVLAASGMATGGRVLHHLETMAPNHRNTIVLTGFQAAGTRGDALAHGASSIRMFGQDVPVRATVERIDSLSAHADADELVAWLSTADAPASGSSIVHGEPAAADALRARLRNELGWDAHVTLQGDHVEVPSRHAESP